MEHHLSASLFQAYAESSALEGIAMKAAMILPSLLIQKSHSRSKTKEHVKHLEHLWNGSFDSLLDEGRTIQSCLKRECKDRNKPNDQLAKTFSKLMIDVKSE